ncbi:MAG: ATP-binding protein [Streptosporangiaceae bacterium]
MRWRRVFPGNEDQVRLARKLVGELLAEHPNCDDIVLCTAEMCTNAVKFTASGRGGVFAVEVSWAGATVRIAVADQGGPTAPLRGMTHPEDLQEAGRGLNLIARLSSTFGVEGDHCGRVIWAQFRRFDVTVPAADRLPLSPYPATIQDTFTLANRYTGWHIWFGYWTRQWWALPRHCESQIPLVTESTAVALAHRLDSLQRNNLSSVTEPRNAPPRA